MYLRPCSSWKSMGGSSSTVVGVSAKTLQRCEWPMSVRWPSSFHIGRHSRACSGAKMYSNSSSRTRRAVAEVDVDVRQLLLVRQAAEPGGVLGGEHRSVGVERVAGGLVVVRVVHPAGDGGVVVAEDRLLGHLADEIGALVGRAAVADRVAEAVVNVDTLAAVGLEHSAERLVVGVRIAENPESHFDARAELKHEGLDFR